MKPTTVQKENLVKQYYRAIVFAVCVLPYAIGWPRSWVIALTVTALVYAAMVWITRRMPVTKDQVNSKTQMLVIAFAALMLGHVMFIRYMAGF